MQHVWNQSQKTELIRISCYQGKLTIDRNGTADGRGMYICKKDDCLKKAKKRRVLNRNFGNVVSQEEIDRVYEELENER